MKVSISRMVLSSLPGVHHNDCASGMQRQHASVGSACRPSAFLLSVPAAVALGSEADCVKTWKVLDTTVCFK